jgi:hypothetical protein
MTYLPAFTTINISARMELPLRCIWKRVCNKSTSLQVARVFSWTTW